MKTLSVVSLLVAVLFASVAVALQQPEHPPSSELDTNRDAVVLDVDAVRPEGTYLDTLSVHAVTDMELAGMQVHTTNDMSVEIETKVTDLAEGSHQVDVTFQSFVLHMDTLGATVDCDSYQKSASSASTNEEICQPLYDSVGTSARLIVDDQGQVAEQEGTGSSSSTSSSNSQMSATTDQFMATNRLLNLMASHPVAPGDSWDATQSSHGESFEGTATLLGYQQYQGHDVAVVAIKGVQRFDMEILSQKYSQVFSGLGSDVSISDMDMQATLYYDPQAKFARYSTVDIAFTMGMKSPLDDTDMTIPIQETVISSTQLKDK